MRHQHLTVVAGVVATVLACLLPTVAVVAEEFLYSRAGDIYLMAVDDGGDVVRDVPLTGHPANDVGPRWSPDGSRIVFNSDRHGDSQLYFMAPDGRNVRPVTPDERVRKRIGLSSWSRDGRRIAVTVWDDVFVIDAATGQAELVYTDPAHDIRSHCRWAPDGIRLALHDGGVDVAILNTDTRELLELPNGRWIEWSRSDLLVLDEDRRNIVWYSVDGIEMARHRVPAGGDVQTFAVSPEHDDRLAVFTLERGGRYALNYWEVGGPRLVNTTANLGYAAWRGRAGLDARAISAVPAVWGAIKAAAHREQVGVRSSPDRL
jgi:dipeptidyl aminopeptidase/acylaminoacyl peptidase